MKKQIVAILAIIAVITTLLTVNALSNEVGYKLSPCDAIDTSIENATVIDFLNATNMTTVQVYNFKGYKGENTWMVQWSSSDRLLDVYVNIATGNIAGIEEKKESLPSAQTSETPRWHPVISFMGTELSSTAPVKTLETFAIRGEKWRVQYLSSADPHARYMTEKYGGAAYSAFSVSLFSEDGERLSGFLCTTITCNKTQHIYRGDQKGTDTYYFNVNQASSHDWWEILVEDYY